MRKYLANVRGFKLPELEFELSECHFPTLGPRHRYGAVLFVEKEGFMPLFEAVKLAERYDLAIMSTKGMSVTASRKLVEELCARHGIPLLVLHDFDKSGFSIAGTLQRDTRRYTFSSAFKIHDLGLRIGDIEGLETEDVVHNASDYAVAANLSENGATEDGNQFLVVETRGVERVRIRRAGGVHRTQARRARHQEGGPDDKTLAQAAERARAKALINEKMEAIVEEASEEAKQMATITDLPPACARSSKRIANCLGMPPSPASSRGSMKRESENSRSTSAPESCKSSPRRRPMRQV